MNLSNTIIPISNGKFNNPKVTYVDSKYSIETIYLEDGPKIYMSKDIETPMSLFTSGFMKIDYIAPKKYTITSKNNQLINFRCNTIDADNCFKLYRSPLPDFYEFKSIGEENGLYYADWGFIPGSEEFNNLIDGQVFEFRDDAFGTTYKLTKESDKWVGNNFCIHIPVLMTQKGDTTFEMKHEAVFVKQNEVNLFTIKQLFDDYQDGQNVLEYMNNHGLITFNDCRVTKGQDGGDFQSKDGLWAMYLTCTANKSCNFSVDLNFKGQTHSITFGYEHHSKPAYCQYKIIDANVFECIPHHYTDFKQDVDSKLGLKIFMSTDTNFIYKIADIDYESGTNPFEYLASTGFYSVSPRPEACTTLYTNFNIKTSGIVIGENIESHFFVLNSLGNTLDIAVNDIISLRNYCIQLQKQIDIIKPKQEWYDKVFNFIQIASGYVMGFGKWFKLGIEGIQGLGNLVFQISKQRYGVDMPVNEVIYLDDLDAIPNTVRHDIDFIEEVPILTNDEGQHCYKYICNGLDDNWKIIIERSIDEENEVINRIEYTHINGSFETTNETIDDDDELEYNPPTLTLLTTKSKPSKIYIEYANLFKPYDLSVNASFTNKQLMSAAAIKKLIENHNTNLMNGVNDQMNNYATKTRELEYTLEKTTNSVIANFTFTLSNQSPNLTATIKMKWVNASKEDDWWQGIFEIKNYEIIKRTRVTGSATKMTVWNTIEDIAIQGTVGSKQTQYGYYYNDGRFLFKPTFPNGGPEFVEIDPEGTTFVESVIYGSDLSIYALKTDIPTIPDDLINNDTLTTTLSDYALKDDIPTIPDDLVNNDTLTTTLNDYAKLTNLDDYATKEELSNIATAIPTIPDDLVNNETLATTLNDYALKSSIPTIPDDLVNNETLTTALNDYRRKDDLSYGNTDVILTKENDILNYEFVDVPFTFTKYSTKILCIIEWYKIFDRNEFYIDATLTKNSKVITGTYKYESTNTNGLEKKYSCSEINYSLFITTSGTITDINNMYIHEGEIVINKLGYNSKPSEFPDNKVLSAKYVNNEFNNVVNNETLATTLNDYALKTDIPTNYIKTNGGNNINGTLTITSSFPSNQDYHHIAHIIAPILTDGQLVSLQIGKERNTEKAIIFSYKEPGEGHLTLYSKADSIIFNSSSVKLCQPTTINGNLTVNGTITGTQSNTTITHYSPIEQSVSSINDFIIGGPIYMSGKVYKQTNEGWQPSTINDTTDCICSVKSKGKWNEYVGICVGIDEDNYSITFATHGDYMVKVNDTSLYSVGDEIFIDDDNVLKILSGNTAITSKIQRTIIGIITAKINDKFMSVFKS